MPYRHLPVRGFGPKPSAVSVARPSREHDADTFMIVDQLVRRYYMGTIQWDACISHAKDAFPLAARRGHPLTAYPFDR